MVKEISGAMMIKWVRRFLVLLLCVIVLTGCARWRDASSGDVLPAGLPEGVSIVPGAGKTFRNQVYCQMDGVDLIFDLHYPDAGEGRYPLVIYVHGGAWQMGDRRGGAGVQFRDALLGAGYAFGAVDYRLAPDYAFPAQIEDVKCAIRFFRANADLLNLDAERFAAMGGSAGGHLVALAGLTADQDLWESAGGYQGVSSEVAAVVDLFGPADLRPIADPAYREPYVGVFGEAAYDAEAIWAYSPLAYVSEDAPPFLILHGDADRVVMLRQSEDFAAALTEAGVPNELIVVAGGGHSNELFRAGAEPDLASLTESLLGFLEENLR
ncbi:alpha/beta hydrolase [bacterium]|nr:alpha/beta hydrolase [bacterium]